jgi:NADH-quinone oxidoreductase subunit K
MIPLAHILAVSAILFVLGAAGFIIRRNIITIFMCIELMLNAVNLAFVAFARHLGNLDGQIFVFFVIVVAAAEATVGLAIIVALYRNRETLAIDEVDSMKD